MSMQELAKKVPLNIVGRKYFDQLSGEIMYVPHNPKPKVLKYPISAVTVNR
jgi:hypothetical protein